MSVWIQERSRQGRPGLGERCDSQSFRDDAVRASSVFGRRRSCESRPWFASFGHELPSRVCVCRNAVSVQFTEVAVGVVSGTYEYLPLKVPYRMTMGIEPLEMDDWIEIDVFYDEEMALRREILETRKEVAIVSRPEAADANWEVLETLADFLPQRFPSRFRRDGALLLDLTFGDRYNIDDKSLDPLEVTSRLIQVHAHGQGSMLRAGLRVCCELIAAMEC